MLEKKALLELWTMQKVQGAEHYTAVLPDKYLEIS